MKIDPTKVVTIDFETYYSQEYSLRAKAYTTVKYVRDPQFHAHCMGIKVGTAPVEVYAGAEIRRVLKRIKWAEHYLLAHNTAFDGLILSERYGVVPAGYLDTLSMARAVFSNHIGASLDEVARHMHLGNKLEDVLPLLKGVRKPPKELLIKLMRYCAVDVELCNGVFWKLMNEWNFPEDELDLIDITIGMFCRPLLVINERAVAKEHKRELQEKKELIASTGLSHKDLSSAVQLAVALETLGVTPPRKPSPSNPDKDTYAFAKTDREFTDLQHHPDKKVANLVAARLAIKSTIDETRAARLLDSGKGKAPVPVMLNYCRAHTTRWSGGDKMNFQNLPRGGALRAALLAPKGHKLVVFDSEQIEARTNAWFAKETKVLQAFAEGRDVYREFAAKVYHKAPEDVTKDERFIGKVAILGLGYQMGAEKFRHTLALGTMGPAVFIEDDLAQEVVTTYRRDNRRIAASWETAKRTLKRMLSMPSVAVQEWGPVTVHARKIMLPSGLALHYPKLSFDDETGNVVYMSKDKPTKIYGGLLIENIIQALARCIVAEQMRHIAREYRVVLMAHDEIVCCVPTTQAKACAEAMKEIMCTPPEWAPDLPLGAKGVISECYEKPD